MLFVPAPRCTSATHWLGSTLLPDCQELSLDADLLDAIGMNPSEVRQPPRSEDSLSIIQVSSLFTTGKGVKEDFSPAPTLHAQSSKATSSRRSHTHTLSRCNHALCQWLFRDSNPNSPLQPLTPSELGNILCITSPAAAQSMPWKQEFAASESVQLRTINDADAHLQVTGARTCVHLQT